MAAHDPPRGVVLRTAVADVLSAAGCLVTALAAPPLGLARGGAAGTRDLAPVTVSGARRASLLTSALERGTQGARDATPAGLRAGVAQEAERLAATAEALAGLSVLAAALEPLLALQSLDVAVRAGGRAAGGAEVHAARERREAEAVARLREADELLASAGSGLPGAEQAAAVGDVRGHVRRLLGALRP